MPKDTHDPGSITVAATDLRKALTECKAIVEKRNTIPVLFYGLLQADAEGLRITVTDLDIEVSIQIDQGEQPNATVLIPVATVWQFARMASGLIKIDVAPNLITIRDDSAAALRLNRTVPNEDWPSMVDRDVSASFSLAEADLFCLLDRVRPSISTEETRYYLNGAYLHLSPEGALRAVATDGHRLARYDVDAPDDLTVMPGVIIPTKAVDAILRNVRKDGNRTVEMAVAEDWLMLCMGEGDALLKAKCIVGKFPDYTRVIPTFSDKFGAVISRDLVGRLSGFDRKGAVAFDPETSRLSLGSSASEFAISLPASVWGEKPFGFRAEYLRDLCRRETVVRLESEGHGHPFTVRGDDPRLLQVIMPMRV